MQDALAAGGAFLLGMAVRVVAEHEGDHDPVAVERPVLRVGDRHRVRDGVAEGERPTVDRRLTVTVGDVLPAVIVALARSDLPDEDVTVSTTVYLRAAV